MKTFRERLQFACDEAGVPPKGRGRGAYLAHHLNTTQEGVRKWLELDSVPRRATVTKLAKLLNVDEVWLVMGKKMGKVLTTKVDPLADLRVAGWDIYGNSLAVKNGVVWQLSATKLEAK